ncbi:amidohydrolase family protein [Cohnella nanjingensis]|uniref:amidohydrolase family protein n=1 Tax=Cohnella nanjingensis TaxID=1387779 RepID=UPI001FE6C501|nr:amidohydrolase family protein [Cohnella nanjingensis]
MLVQSRVNVVACPLINSAMQGRYDAWPKGRGIARVKDLWQAGVNVSVAHDDIASPFYPLGSGNLLQAAWMNAHLSHMTGEEEIAESLRMVTTRAAETLRLGERYGLEVGRPASFVLFEAAKPLELLRLQPPCRYVFSRGRIVAETRPARTVVAMDEAEREAPTG